MNIYKKLNEITKYIDEHLEEKIDYNFLAKFIGVNTYTMGRLFSMIAGITLSDYIRKRRLSNAGFDLYTGKYKIIDIAEKYCYENATSFSRSFEKFHGIKPSKVNKTIKLNSYPRITFNEKVEYTNDQPYEIISMEKLNFYGVGINVTKQTIGKKAPEFLEKTKKFYGDLKYCMTVYDEERIEPVKYYCLYEKKINGFEHITIPESKWLRFSIGSKEEKDIQNTLARFYNEFLPSNKYNLKELPELEYYHDGVTDFLVAIY